MGKTLTRLCFLLLLVALPRGAEARVWYVDNSAAEGGDGRGTTPFQRLKQAEEAAGPGDSIMIAVGDGTARGQDEGIVLKEGQKLVARPADLDDGRRPIITNRDGDGVTLTSNSSVSGILVQGPSGAGVTAANAEGIRIVDVHILTAGTDGISVIDSSDVQLRNVVIMDPKQHGIRAAGVRDLTIMGTRVFGAGDSHDEHGMHLRDLSGEALIEHTRVERSYDDGIRLLNMETEVTMTLVEITVSRTKTGSGVRMDLGGAGASVTVEDSSFLDLAGAGIEVLCSGEGVVRLELVGNVLDRTPRAGLSVHSQEKVTAQVIVLGNILQEIRTVGIEMGSLSGSTLDAMISSNEIRAVSEGPGIALRQEDESSLNGHVDGNTIEGSGTEGITLDAAPTGEAQVLVANNVIQAAGTRGRCTGPLSAHDGHGFRASGSLCLSLDGNESTSAQPSCAGYALSSEEGDRFRVVAATLPDLESRNGGGPVQTSGDLTFVTAQECPNLLTP